MKRKSFTLSKSTETQKCTVIELFPVFLFADSFFICSYLNRDTARYKFENRTTKVRMGNRDERKCKQTWKRDSINRF